MPKDLLEQRPDFDPEANKDQIIDNLEKNILILKKSHTFSEPGRS